MADLLLDPKELVRLQPREGGPAYFLRVPDVADRAKWKHALITKGARKWSQLDLADACMQAIKRLLPDEEDAPEREARLAEVEAYAQGIRESVAAILEERNEETTKALWAAIEMSPRLLAIFEAVSLADETLARRAADNAVYAELAGLVAARMFLEGWEGEGLPFFRRSKLGLDDAMLRRVPTGDLVAIGERIAGLIEPSPERLGNSGSASSTSSDPKPSREERTPPESIPSPTATTGTSTGSAAA